MLEKQHEINQKAFDKIQKSSDELVRERDAIHKELKKTESMKFHLRYQYENELVRILMTKLVRSWDIVMFMCSSPYPFVLTI